MDEEWADEELLSLRQMAADQMTELGWKHLAEKCMTALTPVELFNAVVLELLDWFEHEEDVANSIAVCAMTAGQLAAVLPPLDQGVMVLPTVPEA